MKILIVEDDDERRGLLKKYLQNNAIEVLVAQDGYEAMTLLKSYKVDLIMSDANMPGMDGYILAKRAKSDPDIKSTPFFLYSSKQIPYDNIDLAMELGADRCLVNTEIKDIGEEALSFLNKI
jgi:CheY-like chemotaxis protein